MRPSGSPLKPRATYARKRKHTERLRMSSPLSPGVDGVSHTHMAQRMMKRARRAALEGSQMDDSCSKQSHLSPIPEEQVLIPNTPLAHTSSSYLKENTTGASFRLRSVRNRPPTPFHKARKSTPSSSSHHSEPDLGSFINEYAALEGSQMDDSRQNPSHLSPIPEEQPLIPNTPLAHTSSSRLKENPNTTEAPFRPRSASTNVASRLRNRPTTPWHNAGKSTPSSSSNHSEGGQPTLRSFINEYYIPLQGLESDDRSALSPPSKRAPVLDEESDDELLLKGPWLEDIKYLGRPAPSRRPQAEPDELNLGNIWGDVEFAPPPPP